jgi:hypothetical protein
MILNWIIVCESVDYIEVTVCRSQWLDFVNAVIIHLVLKQLGMNNTVTVALYTTWHVNIEQFNQSDAVKLDL